MIVNNKGMIIRKRKSLDRAAAIKVGLAIVSIAPEPFDMFERNKDGVLLQPEQPSTTT